ncbi:MAG: response regulator [Deltaproteobacteria bacterium]|nr:response regulator [Deltaproteobacteria bacterium]
MTVTTIFQNTQESDKVETIIAIFEPYRNELSTHLQKIYHNNIFENSHTLHPSLLARYGTEESDSIITFLKDRDTARVEQMGAERAHAGLGFSSVDRIRAFLNQFVLQKIQGEHADHLPVAFKLIDLYFFVYSKGYLEKSKQQLLIQQKELQQALSTAIIGQRRELIIQKHALKTSINAIMFTDLEGRVTYVNPAFLTLWQYQNVRDVLGMPSSELLSGEAFNDVFNALVEQSKWHGELKAKRKDSSQFDVEMFASLIKDEDDRIIGNMASFVDMTERNRLEAQSRQSHKMEALGQLAGSIAHDFNNILTIMRGYLHVIIMDTDPESQFYRDIVQIRTAVDRGAGITKQLRVFSKDTDVEMVPIDLNETISESYELLKHIFPANMKLTIDLDSQLWPIKANISQLSQILVNFCVNARDAIIKKGAQFTDEPSANGYAGLITVQSRNIELDSKSASRYLKATPGQYVRLRVQDNGFGISDDVIDRIFEPFFSTKKSENNCGLGLSIVYGIIQKHKGFIDVQSIPGEGTLFDIFFPVAEMDRISETPGNALAVCKSSKKETVLVVDDEYQVITLLKRLLNGCGYRVITAENGKKALTIYASQYSEIDLVLLDIIMPEMRGLECFRKMKEIDPDVKVVINTGYTGDDSAAQMLMEGAKAIVEKPFDVNRLSATISKVLTPSC